MKNLCTALAILICAGCSTTVREKAHHQWRPEIIVHGSNAETIRQALATQFIDAGFQIKNTDSMVMVMERDATTFANAFLYGTFWDSDVFARLRLTIVQASENPPAHRVIGSLSRVSNQGTSFEIDKEVRGEDLQRLQRQLDFVEAKLNASAN